MFYASDYFEQLPPVAVELIKIGKAYVCSLSPKEREYRGTLTEPGKESLSGTVRGRKSWSCSRHEGRPNSLTLHNTLRAKIDMASAYQYAVTR